MGVVQQVAYTAVGVAHSRILDGRASIGRKTADDRCSQATTDEQSVDQTSSVDQSDESLRYRPMFGRLSADFGFYQKPLKADCQSIVAGRSSDRRPTLY